MPVYDPIHPVDFRKPTFDTRWACSKFTWMKYPWSRVITRSQRPHFRSLKTISLSKKRRKGRAFISWRSSGREAGEKQPLEALPVPCPVPDATTNNVQKEKTATTPTPSREATAVQEGETETRGGFQPGSDPTPRPTFI
jgi:hypothetical protein